MKIHSPGILNFTIFDQNNSVKVIINTQVVSIFNGARVCDAVLAYSKPSYKLLKEGRLTVTDQYGNILAADGSLTEGQIILLPKEL